jgi:DNA-binding MurR/RpiR family transcriptional regulator
VLSCGETCNPSRIAKVLIPEVGAGRHGEVGSKASAAGLARGDKSAFFRRLHASSLSPKHRAIARYLAGNYRTAASQTAAEVAATVHTSEATVIRFANRLGYEGYPELRRQLHRMIYEDLTSIELLARPLPQPGRGPSGRRGRTGDTLTTVVQAEMEHLRALAAELPRHELGRLVRGLQTARRVYVAGHRVSASLAEFFGYTLAKVHEDVVTLTAGGSSDFDAFRAVPPSAWLVAIAFPRYPLATLELMELAREDGIAVVAITDSVLSPAAKRADLVVPVRTEPVSFVDSHCAVQALLAAILVEYGLRARERTETLLGRFERIAARQRIFHTPE